MPKLPLCWLTSQGQEVLLLPRGPTSLSLVCGLRLNSHPRPLLWSPACMDPCMLVTRWPRGTHSWHQQCHHFVYKTWHLRRAVVALPHQHLSIISCFASHVHLLLRDSPGWNGDKYDFIVTITTNKNYDCQYLGGTHLWIVRWSELTAWKIVGPGRKQSCKCRDYFPCDTAVSRGWCKWGCSLVPTRNHLHFLLTVQSPSSWASLGVIGVFNIWQMWMRYAQMPGSL